MDGACDKNGGEDRSGRVWWGNLGERYNLDNLGHLYEVG